jgi:pimeloyl-ACP methyl ester carboxylesterase
MRLISASIACLFSLPLLNAQTWNDIDSGDREILYSVYVATNGADYQYGNNWFLDGAEPMYLNLIRDPDWSPSDEEDPVYFVSGFNIASARTTGFLPTALGNLEYLASINVFNNELTGGFPTFLLDNPRMGSIDLESNNFSGELPSGFGDTPAAQDYFHTLNVAQNNFEGEIPPTIGNTDQLTRLYMGFNNFTGPIPASIGNLDRLQHLQLENNELTGELPDSMANLSFLQILRLENNNLDGPIPEWLGNFQSLDRIRLFGNFFSGKVPASFAGLVNVRFIELQDNNLTDMTAIAGIVDNPEFALREVNVLDNRIDFSEGSPNLAAVQKLRDAGVTVRYRRQQGPSKNPEVGVAIRAMDPEDYPLESQLAGLTDIDAPLVPPTDPDVLAAQWAIDGGLVADGVTPLLIECATLMPGSTESYIMRINVTDGGSVFNPFRFFVLEQGHWIETDQVSFTQQEDVRFAYLAAIPSDDVTIGSGADELTAEIQIVDNEGAIVGVKEFAIRKPPVTFIHGYNTDGNWGRNIHTELGRTRPYRPAPPPGEDDPDNLRQDNFVITVRYGQYKPDLELIRPEDRAFYKDIVNHENTTLPLAALVPLVDERLQEALAPLRERWAFTRHDVVAHSQGGLLTRMLANRDPVPQAVWTGTYATQSLALGYRNGLNAFRGRFHRAITIGSPHNGSRLLGYLIKLDLSEASYRLIPKGIAGIAILSGKAQDKFDPFGDQIRALNDPNGAWIPDPGARFHLVRTTIYDGKAPDIQDRSYIARLLQLDKPSGALVLPRGYDGIVDFDAMGALGDGQSVPENVFTLPPTNQVSHSGPAVLFDQKVDGAVPTVGQTDSQAVAEHVALALEQTSWADPASIKFGPFPLPELLGPDVEAQIEEAAKGDTFLDDYILGLELLVNVDIQNLKARVQNASPANTRSSYIMELEPPVDLPIDGEVFWSAEWWNGLGVTQTGVSLETSGENSRRVTLGVGTEIIGDLVLYAMYTAADGTVVVAEPARVASIEPDAEPVQLYVFPATGTLTVDADFAPEMLVEYSDGSFMRRYIKPGELTVVSSNPARLDVSDPFLWRAASVGEAEVTVTWNSLQAKRVYTVTDSENPPFSDWASAYFTEGELSDPAIGGPGSDPDEDGYVNLIEQLTGYRPDVADGAGRLAAVPAGEQRLVMELALSTAGLGFSIERSSTPFGPWQTIFTTQSSSPLESLPGVSSTVSGNRRVISLPESLVGGLPGFFRVTAGAAD